MASFQPSETPISQTLILGPSYISMTLDNIAEGKPMAVYASEGEFLSFFYITLNNLWVDIRTFASGLITCYGTITSLLYNGIWWLFELSYINRAYLKNRSLRYLFTERLKLQQW